MNFDISQLPKPALIQEYTIAEKIEWLKNELKFELPAWTGSDADPAMKIFKAVAALDCLRDQRVNDAARRLLIAFAKGSDLDNIRPEIPRLTGTNATCICEIEADAAGVVPEGFEITDTAGNITGITTESLTFSAAGKLEIEVEITNPAGILGNGISGKLTEQTEPNPIIISVTQKTAASGGADVESDDRYIQRLLLAPSANMGGWKAYAFYTLTADVNIKECKIKSPAPGNIDVILLSSEGDGTAGSAMIDRVEDALDPEDIRPQSDIVEVMSSEIISYALGITVYLRPGVEQRVVSEVLAKATAAVSSLHKCGYDINESVLAGLCYVSGVSKLVLSKDGAAWSDIVCTDYEAAYCTGVSASFGGFGE